MRVPFVDLSREWRHFEARFLEATRDFGRQANYILGEATASFEADFAKYYSYRHAVTVSSGLAALEVSLLAHGLKPGDEVISVSNSAVATSLAISHIGAKPVFADIGPDFLIDPAAAAKLIGPKTKAILPVHLFGKICDLEALQKLAEKHELIIIEDACQAAGAKLDPKIEKQTKAFSFYPTKNLGAIGEGGLILTDDQAIADFARSYRDYGQSGRYNHVIKGNNYRIDALQCVFLKEKLKELDTFTDKRQQIAKRYIESLKNINSLIINDFDDSSAYHLFVIRVKDGRRDGLQDFLKQAGIDTLIHYPLPIHQQPCYLKEHANISLPQTEAFQTEILSLPCYPFLADEEQDYIIEKIKEYCL